MNVIEAIDTRRSVKRYDPEHVMPEEDLQYIKEAMDAAYERHGVDPKPHRELSCKGDDEAAAATNKTYRRKVACIGGSF